jgi:SOS-response transcriptional repressor LexA
MDKLAEGTFFRLQVYGNDLEGYKLFNGDVIKLQAQRWANNDELVLCRDGQEYKIEKYKKDQDGSVQIVAVVRQRITDF